MKIGQHDIETSPFIIAEIGVAHEGDFSLAEQMIDLAAEAGANAVKFQTFSVGKNRYLSTSIDQERFNRTQGYEFSEGQWNTLAERAKSKGVAFLSTPFDFDSADLINRLSPAIKIASGDLTFFPLLEHVAKYGKPIILSCGMATQEEIDQALRAIDNASDLELRDQVVLLHCVASYPCPQSEANLGAMLALKEQYGLHVGYSNHVLGTTATEVAVSMGASVVEVHFTYRKENQTFRDHALSFDPNDLEGFVKKVSDITEILGSNSIGRNQIEQENAVMMRRSLALDADLAAGDTIEAHHITYLRPATGLGTDRVADVIGRTVNKNLTKGTILTGDDLA